MTWRRQQWRALLLTLAASALYAAGATSVRSAVVSASSPGRPLVTDTGHYAIDAKDQTTERTTDPIHDDKADGWKVTTPKYGIQDDVFVVIGVKTSVVSGLRERQAIHDTWGHVTSAAVVAVRIVFLGCEPRLDPDATATERQAIDEAVAREKREYGDLLTHELGGCVDSYLTLVDKTLSFLHWASVHYPHAAYVMVTDDDVYVRVDKLATMLHDRHVTPRRRFYGGQVWATQFQATLHPIRTPTAKNHVTTSTYPFSTLLPFATGPHYVLSMDLVHFLARNRRSLRGVGTLEDVSVAFWLQSLLRVQPTHLYQFDNLRFSLCHNGLVSYTNLSPTAMRIAHQNLLRHQSFCSGFSFTAWAKEATDTSLPTMLLTGPGRTLQPIELTWDLQYHPATRMAHVVTSFHAIQSNESMVVVYTASQDSFLRFCRDVLDVAAVEMPTTALDGEFCTDVRTKLTRFLRNAMADSAHLQSLFALTETSLRQGTTSAAVFVRLLSRARIYRIFVENLLVTMYPDAHAYVLDEHDYATRFRTLPPDLEIAVAGEEVGAQEAATRTRRIVIGDVPERTPLGLQDDHVVLIVSRVPEAVSLDRSIHVVSASLGFLNRTTHTPLALLNPHASATHSHKGHDRGFALVDCSGLTAVALAAAQGMRRLLHEDGMAVTTAHCDTTSSDNDVPVPRTLDEQVAYDATFQFALVVENRRDPSDDVSNGIVTAFLAGAVPIYYGHAPTVTRLFNPDAFINCANETTLRACAQRVLAVHASPVAYEQMRRAPPIVNHEAFCAAFSWHTAVEEVCRYAYAHVSMGQRLKALLEAIEA